MRVDLNNGQCGTPASRRSVMTVRNSSRPIARVFRATAAPGCRDELLQRFHSSSAVLVNSKVGCLKYRILEPVDASAPEVVFESIWRDLDAPIRIAVLILSRGKPLRRLVGPIIDFGQPVLAERGDPGATRSRRVLRVGFIRQVSPIVHRTSPAPGLDHACTQPTLRQQLAATDREHLLVGVIKNVDFIDASGKVTPLITVWLEVRILPGPPRIPAVAEISCGG